MASPEDVRRWKEHLGMERDGQVLYRALAAADTIEERAAVWRELADSEARHAARWEQKLREAGVPVAAEWRPSWRARTLALLARLFGVASVAPLITALEAGEAEGYAAHPESRDLVADEQRAQRLMVEVARGGASPAERIIGRERWHRGGGGGSLRAAIFGINDGLVSNLSLVMGVAGANPGNHVILLAGVAGLLAGAASMAAGEYISMRAQRELFERQIALEREELETAPEEEQQELALIYRAKGIPRAEAERLAGALMRDASVALDTLAREELGLDPSELGSPWGAAASSFVSFAIGAIIPILPYLAAAGALALPLSALLSAVALFAVGAGVSLLTGRGLLLSGARMLLIGAGAAVITYLVGTLLGVATS